MADDVVRAWESLTAGSTPLTERDAYTAEAVAKSLEHAMALLQWPQPGTLTSFALQREDEGDFIEVWFTLDSRPDVVYFYRQLLYSVHDEPQMAALSTASIFYAILLERIDTWRVEPVDGVIDLASSMQSGSPAQQSMRSWGRRRLPADGAHEPDRAELDTGRPEL